jgi:hypothetical protein
MRDDITRLGKGMKSRVVASTNFKIVMGRSIVAQDEYALVPVVD